MKYNEEDSNNGIVRIKQNGIQYTVWTHVWVVIEHIKEELRKRFPGKLIIREFNKIDLSIPEDNLPVEIQSTILGGSNIRYSSWEDRIRRQIEQNIINSGRCWFFFDSELLRAIKDACKRISINMDWFRKYMKEEKLKVFTVNHDGVIEEKDYKDFDFLSEMSQTCPIAAEADDMVLGRNKMNIFANVIKWHEFNQEEIDKFENDFEKYNKENKIYNEEKNERRYKFLTGHHDERSKLYGYILAAIGHLERINKVFDGNIVANRGGLVEGVYLGIFESEGIMGGNHNNRMRFIDYPVSSQYFPAYLRHKDKWDEFKGKWLSTKQFEGIIKGNIDYNWYKKYENTDDDQNRNNNKEINQNQVDNDKEVNIKIDNKDQIININIKSKQRGIYDAWEL